VAQPRKPFTPWTADTEKAFLLALRLCGKAKQAAREIGRGANTAFKRRQRYPEFARAWDEAIAQQQADWIAARRRGLDAEAPADDGAGGGRLAPGQEKKGGWDARKRGLFLRTLARTKRIDLSCEAAGMSASAAHYLRAKSARFAAAWEKALGGSVPSVIDVAWERAVEGWTEPVVQNGQVVGERWRFAQGLMRELLRHELAAQAASTKLKPWQRPRSLDDVRDSILRKLEAIERRRLQEEAEARGEVWDGNPDSQ
jgi:hypothetical protein